MPPVLEDDRKPEAGLLPLLQPRFAIPGKYDYGEMRFDETPLDEFEGVSSGMAKSRVADADLGDDAEGESFEVVSSGTDEGACGEVWGTVTLMKRMFDPFAALRVASDSWASAAEPEAPAKGVEEPPVNFDDYDRPQEYGGSAAQFDGRVDDIDFMRGSDEPCGGEEQNECELDETYTDEPDGFERL
jgi:hypothetical protein